MTTFRQLEAITAVVEMGSFEAAATRLGIAQSAVSRHLKDFEGLFNYPLFDRTGRSARLTLAGNEVLTHAKSVLTRRDQIFGAIASSETMHRTVKLGITELCALTWLPAFIAAMRREHPALSFAVEVNDSATLHSRLLAGELDIVVAPDIFPALELATFAVGKARLRWCCSPQFDAPKTRVSMSTLSDYPLLIQRTPSAVGSWMRARFDEHLVTVQGEFSSGSLVALAGLAASAIGIALLPTAVYAPLVANGLLRVVGVTPRLPPMRYVAILRPDGESSFLHRIVKSAMSNFNFDFPYQSPTARMAKGVPRVPGAHNQTT